MAKDKKVGQTFLEALQSVFAVSVIVIAYGIALFIYFRFLGNPANFEGGNPAGHPLPGNFLGMMYKGGWHCVPILISLIIILITFTIERLITLSRSRGRGRLNIFVRKLQVLLTEEKIDEAIESCDKQRGSLANVMKAGLTRYKELKDDPTLERDQKIVALQKELEEGTALELPMLSKNLVFLSTIASIAVLFGLLGTVIGMIRAFGALAQAGAPDALALATGISEALINTAFGILGSTLAIIFYNALSTSVDNITYKIDEAGFSLVQTFASHTK